MEMFYDCVGSVRLQAEDVTETYADQAVNISVISW